MKSGRWSKSLQCLPTTALQLEGQRGQSAAGAAIDHLLKRLQTVSREIRDVQTSDGGLRLRGVS
jgi:hypothetical protein